jgi:uncharacterized protein YbjQ (UPF0145 family)
VEFIIDVAPFIILILLGLFVGRTAERRHIRNLDERESKLGDFLVSQTKDFANAVPGGRPPAFVAGEVVIASDYLKTFLSGLRRIFGGELRSYQTLLTRARREALLRVIESAKSQGYNAICNVRYDSADIGGNAKAKRIPMAAAIASATAYQRAGGTS